MELHLVHMVDRRSTTSASSSAENSNETSSENEDNSMIELAAVGFLFKVFSTYRFDLNSN